MKNHLTHKIEPNQHELNRLTHELRTPNDAFFKVYVFLEGHKN